MSQASAVLASDPDSSRFKLVRKQLFINSGLLGLSRVLSAATSMITVPVVLARLGIAGYGSWESMMAIAALVTVFQTTISGTLIWKMSAFFGSEEFSQIERLMGVGIAFVLGMFSVVAPLAWTFRHQLTDLANPPVIYRAASLLVIPILVSQLTLGALSETFAAVLIAYQRAGISTLIQTGALMANSAFVIVGLLNDWQVWSLLLGNTVGVIVGIAGQYIAVVRISGIRKVWPSAPSWSESKPLLKYAGFLALGQISIALRDQADKLVLANVGSTSWTAWFGLASRLASLTLVACSFFYVPLVSAVASLAAQGDWPGVRRIYANTMIGMPYIAGVFVVIVASAYDRLLGIWINRSVPEVGPILFTLLAGNITAVVLTGVGSSLCKGLGKVSVETIYIVICVVTNILLKIVLTPWLGPIGAVVASSTSWIFGSVIFVILLHKSVELPNTVIRAAAMIPMMAISIAATRLFASHLPQTQGRFQSALAASGIGAVSAFLFSALLLCFRILEWSAVERVFLSVRNSAVARLGAR